MALLLRANRSSPPAASLLVAEYIKPEVQVRVEWSDSTELQVSSGVTLTWNHTIARYLCRLRPEFGLYGRDHLQAAEIDHWVDFSSRLLARDSLSTALEELNTALAPRTYLVGYRVTLADMAVFAAFHSHKSLQAAKLPTHVVRWYSFCLAQNSFQSVMKSIFSERSDQSGCSKGPTEGGKFIELPGAEEGSVVVRFPPEASGFLHIGHAKAALLNQYYQLAYKGKLIMRFDDTNPAKEKDHFEKVILEDVAMLQIKPDHFSYTSDHFDLILQYAEQLIKDGLAFCDDTTADELKNQREQREASKHRSAPVAEVLKHWEEMKKGTEEGQRWCLRAKIDHASDNGCLRDPTIYRCRNESHPRFGVKYKAYPTYDFACPIVDSVEGVTHALRTTEYHDRDPQYYWFINALKLREVYVWEYSRLTMVHTVMSKRKLAWLVQEGLVDGWDDPRFPTVRGILRRGLTVAGLKEFIISQGSSRSNVHMEWDKIWAVNRKVIDPVAPRYTALLKSEAVPLTIEDDIKTHSDRAAKHPKNPNVGEKVVWYSKHLLIDGADAELLKVGEKVTLINWGNAVVTNVEKKDGKVVALSARLHLDDKVFKDTAKLTWLADVPEEGPFIPTVCTFFDHLLTKEVLTKEDNFKEFLNTKTKWEEVMVGDPCLADVQKGDIVQLQRRGFFICDQPFQPMSLHTGQPAPCVLFAIPDGHSKVKPTAGAKTKTSTDGAAQSKGGSSKKKKEDKAKAATGDKPAVPAAAPAGGALSAEAASVSDAIVKQGDAVRALKTQGASKADVMAQVEILKSLKADFKKLTGTEWQPSSGAARSAEKKEEKKPAATPAGGALSAEAASVSDAIVKQGDAVRALKAQGASKADVMAQVEVLKSLKADFKKLTGAEWQPAGGGARPVEKKKEETKKEEKPKKEKGKEAGAVKGTGDVAKAGEMKKQTRLGLEAKKEEDFPEWYTQVITKSEMIEYYDVSGCYIIRPWAFTIWEGIKEFFDAEIKKLGVENCYFPIFVSQGALEREKTHIEDFAPEVAWVTKSGQSDLAEPIAIRPTSETVMYPAYARWIQSHRDLPMKLNQWNNVVRWEFKHPQPFLRTREFLWQEGHTAWANAKDAQEEVYTILELYARVYEELMAVPVIRGRKTEKEKFAGGDFTTTVEAYIATSGRGIQGGTSHHLGQNFSKMFDITIEDPTKATDKLHIWQNSWGLTTRTIGVMTMVHGDNQGLVLPPRLACIQVVIVPCGVTAKMTEVATESLMKACSDVGQELSAAGVRTRVDDRDKYSPGWKFNHWELKGVPVRVEIGPRDLEKSEVVAVTRNDGQKFTFKRSDLVKNINDLLENIQKAMYQHALKERDAHLKQITDWKNFSSLLDQKNLLLAPFCGEEPCEDLIKKESARADPAADAGAPAMGAKSLCIPFDQPAMAANQPCIHPACKSNAAKCWTLFGRSY